MFNIKQNMRLQQLFYSVRLFIFARIKAYCGKV